MTTNLGRREFLGTSAAAVAGLALAGPAARAQDGLPPLRVRRNLGTLDPTRPDDQKVIDQYTQGVNLLKQRSAADWNDPRGWAVQAGLHTARCQHGSWWFFPWHRAYLYYFERMIQDAIGDPAFALPYWDWTDSTQLALPAAFRNPSSPLFDNLRVGTVNDGSDQLDWSFYDQDFGGLLNFVLNRPAFVPAFGSPQAAGFPGLERAHGPDLGHGDVEGGPHDTVHVWIGGVGPDGRGARDMGNPTFAALDPIFWLHHCNIDRLWTRWRLQDPANHLNPTDPTWGGQPFEFLRPDGQAESIAVGQVVDSRAAPLNYRYDDEPAPAPLLAVVPAFAAAPLRRTIMAMHPPAGDPGPAVHPHPDPHPLGGATLATVAPRFEVGSEPVTVSLQFAAPARATVAMAMIPRPANVAPEAHPRLLLAIEGIEFEGKAAGLVAVYLNAPKIEGDAHPDKGHAVGTFTFFAGHHHGAPAHQPALAPAPGAVAPPPPPPPPQAQPQPPPPGVAPAAAPAADAPRTQISRVFDVTEVVRKLRAAGKWDDNQLRVTLVQRPLHGKRRDIEGKVSFARATLITGGASR